MPLPCGPRTSRRNWCPGASALVPGEPLTVALRLAMDRGWHTYWQNPGDSGLPTTLAWKLPAPLRAGPIQWPAPQVLPVGPLVNYGYEGESAAVDRYRDDRRRRRSADRSRWQRAPDWLVCKEVCIPEGADLDADRCRSRRSAAAPRRPMRVGARAIARTRASFPRALSGWNASATAHGSVVDLV